MMRTVGRPMQSSEMCMLRLLCSLGFMVVICDSADVVAQTPARDPVGAEALFRQGVAAKKRNDWETACDKFRKSMELEPAVSTQFKIASCDEHAGKLATAWYEYRLAQTMNRETSSERRRSELEQSIRTAMDALEPRLPTLRISVTPNDPAIKIEIERDDVAVVPSSVLGEALPIDPGEHSIVVRAPGYFEKRAEVSVAEGKAAEVAVNLVPMPPPAAAPAATNAPVATKPQPSAPVPQQPPQKPSLRPALQVGNGQTPFRDNDVGRGESSSQKQVAWVIGGAGVFTLGVAGYYGIRTLWLVGKMDDHKKRDGTYDTGVWGPHDAAKTSQTTGLVMAGIGAALTGLSVVLYATAPKGTGAGRAQAAPQFVVGIAPAAVFAHGEW